MEGGETNSSVQSPEGHRQSGGREEKVRKQNSDGRMFSGAPNATFLIHSHNKQEEKEKPIGVEAAASPEKIQ